MFMQSRTVRAAAFAALLLGLAACASQKEPAEAALAAAEAKFKEMGGDIQKYLPERYAEVEQRIAGLRDSVAKQDYGDVVAGAAAAQDDIKRAVADARIERAKVLMAMEDEWNDMVKSVPAMITAMDKKISSQRGRPPQGMTADAWKQTIADYDAARDAWSKASAEMTSQTFEATVLAAREAKAKISAIMDSLGVKAS
jgi:DNA repair exonuclease SbcCD ATPase subunit